MRMKTNVWKVVAICLASIILLSVIFAIPLTTVPHQTTETYYETEMQQESYVVDEPYVTEELLEKTEVVFDGFRVVVPKGVDVPFCIDKPDSRLAVSFENPVPGGFYIYSSSGRIVYEELGNRGAFEIPLREGEYKARFRENSLWGEQVYIRVAIKWTDLEEVTRYKEVVEYREVPVQVEKQRTVTEYERVPVWEWLFGD